MPEEWKLTLQNSSITLNEQLQNPQAVIDALDFYHHQHNSSLSKYMYPSDKSNSWTIDLSFFVYFKILKINRYIHNTTKKYNVHKSYKYG